MINRRAFLGSLAACAVAPLVPLTAPVAAPALAFHPKAFALAMEPLTVKAVTRYDVLYGFGLFNPNATVRILEP